MNKTVVVVSSQKDEQAKYVMEGIVRRGGHALLLETARVPEQAGLSWEEGRVSYQGQALEEYRSFYVKSIYLSLPSEDPGHFSSRNFSVWQEQYIAERERHSFLTSVLRSLQDDGRSFVNPMQAMDLHFLKLYQLARLRQAGVRVPASLGTCSAEAIQAFAQKHEGVIYKPLAGGALVRRLASEDLAPQRLALLQNAPVLFQEEVLGEEYRAYVLDGEPVTAFQIPLDGAVDARTRLDHVEPAELPEEGWELCIRAVEALGLVFSAVDLRRTKEGEYVIFECNPTPAISYFEDPVDGKIVNRLAQYLLAKA